jgi:AcrR family transcriptional regulator
MPELTAALDDEHAAGAVRTRDATRTRLSLLQAARLRFAREGYAATTVRDIAADAGVNVALINRYFASKEGLFAACLTRAVEELDVDDRVPSTLDEMLQDLVRRVVEPPTGEHSIQLLLLLRSSGDEGADAIRHATLRTYAERIAAIAGWRADDASTQHLLLRAQIALAALFGMTMLRTSLAVEPITSAPQDELAGPLRELMTALLAPGR